MNQRTKMWLYTCIEDGSDWSFYIGAFIFLLYLFISIDILLFFVIGSFPLGIIIYALNDYRKGNN